MSQLEILSVSKLLQLHAQIGEELGAHVVVTSVNIATYGFAERIVANHQ